MAEIRTKRELAHQLLKLDLSALEQKDLFDTLDFLLGLSDEDLESVSLRKRILETFNQHLGIFPASLKQNILDFLIKVSVIHARTDFYTYVKIMAPTVINAKYRDGRHIQIICEELQNLYDSYIAYLEDPENNDTGRLQVFLSPRSMKSVLCSILFPSWVLGRRPTFRFLLIGNNSQNAADNFGRPLKNLIAAPEYREVFPETRIDSKVDAAGRFNTTAGGGYFCAGGGTAIAGKGGDFIICDDLLSEQTAYSKPERTKINNNYIPGIRSRAQPGAAELIVNTRWNLDDLSAHIGNVDGIVTPEGEVRKGGKLMKRSEVRRPWRIVSVPAILDGTASALLRRKGDPAGLYEEGSSYWPEWKPLKDLIDIKESYMATEPHKWNALFMQNPVPDEGAIVKYEDFNVWPEDKPLPKMSSVFVSVDSAFGETERADNTAIQVWGVFMHTVQTSKGPLTVPNMMLLWATAEKMDYDPLVGKCDWLRDRSEFRPIDYFVVEKKASGIVLCQDLYRRGFPLVEFDPRGKKFERLQAAAAIMKSGRVWIQKGKAWAESVREEVCSFPSFGRDDQVDALSLAVIFIRDNGQIRHEDYERDYDEDDFDEEFRDMTPANRNPEPGYENSEEVMTSFWGSLFR